MVDHIYCINLEGSPERRENAQQQFEREGLEVEFFRATDGTLEAPKDLFISKSEWGCAESHIRVWRDIVYNGYDTALVFEDDISLDPDFKYKLDQIIDELPQDWDFVNLGAPTHFRDDMKKVSENVVAGQSVLAHAYLIRLKCAKKWCDFQSTHLKVAIDVLMMYFPTNNLHVTEPIAHQNDSMTSTIANVYNLDKRFIDYNLIVKRWGLPLIVLCIIFVLYIFRKPVLG
jgi:GR25 family glycosyltransferase involved in LPS biosynthesis